MLQAPEIEPSAGLTRRIMCQVKLDSRRSGAGSNAPVFKPWFGVAAAVAVIAVVFGLRFIYPNSGGSSGCAVNNEQWLANAQEADGSWNPERYGGSKAYRPALTALSALALHRSGVNFAGAVERACHYLSEIQQPDGSFGDGGGRQELYNQAIVTYVLAETCIEEHRIVVLQKAVEFIKSCQSGEGGWDYIEKSQGNAAATSWQVQALCSAKSCGISGADIPMRKGLRWLRGQTHSDGAVTYNKKSEQTSDTISALAGYALLTAGDEFPELSALGRQVIESMVLNQAGGASNLYRDCMKVRALKAAGKEAGAEVVRTQMIAGIPNAPGDQWVKVGGGLYISSMQALAGSY